MNGELTDSLQWARKIRYNVSLNSSVFLIKGVASYKLRDIYEIKISYGIERLLGQF